MKLKMNNILKMLAVVLFITTTTYGQQRGGQGGPPPNGNHQQGPPPIPSEKQIKSMVSDLSKEILLTDQQEKQVLKLYNAHFNELRQKTEEGKPNREEMQKFRTDFENKIKAVLTEDQNKLYASYLKNNTPQKGGQKKKNKLE